MHAAQVMQQYQRQAILTATPEQITAKIYDLGVTSCHRQDQAKVRAVLIELVAALNFEAGGELAQNLYDLYTFCLDETSAGNLDVVCEILTTLRDAWKEGVLARRAA